MMADVLKQEEEQLLISRSRTDVTGLDSIPLNDQKTSQRDLYPCIPARYLLVIVSSFGFMIVFALRVNLSMAMVVMANATADPNSHLEYRWSSKQQGWILSAFYFGYVLTQIPGGYLAGRFGGRHVFGIGILMTSLLTLLTYLAARIHIGALIALRVLEGAFEGVTFPAMYAILGKWSPSKERSILASIIGTGPSLGIVIALPLSAVLCNYGFGGGWPSVFYVFGSTGIIWFVFWLLFGYSSPATHPRISLEERHYIESDSTIEEEPNDKNTGTVNKVDAEPIPWYNILTSPAVWAIIVCFICFGWANFTLLTCTPIYLKDVLQLSLGKSLLENGIFSALPSIGFVIAMMSGGFIADLLRKKWLSTTVVRKIFTLLSLLLPAAGLILIGYIGSDKVTCISLLVVINGFGGFMVSGFNINHIDIAPQHAGVLMGITNMLGTIPGIVGPIVAETIAHKPPPGENNTEVYQAEWREVFILAAELNVFGAIIYLILGSGKRQWWAGGVTGPDGERRTKLLNSTYTIRETGKKSIQ